VYKILKEYSLLYREGEVGKMPGEAFKRNCELNLNGWDKNSPCGLVKERLLRMNSIRKARKAGSIRGSKTQGQSTVIGTVQQQQQKTNTVSN
jgi:hypothetical protein